MGRLIDADVLKDIVEKWLPKDPCGHEELEHPYEEDICVSTLMTIEEQPTVEAIPKADYENRLKADLKAILVELQLEIEDLDPNYECNTYYAAIRDCSNLIQQKINSLKENKDG